MSEINNTGMSNVNKNLKFSGKKKDDDVISESKAPEQAEKNINELRNDPYEFLGRTQVKFKNTTAFEGSKEDNLKKDLDFFKKNPKLVAKSNMVFEKALNKSENKEDAYAKAVALQKAFVTEFSK